MEPNPLLEAFQKMIDKLADLTERLDKGLVAEQSMDATKAKVAELEEKIKSFRGSGVSLPGLEDEKREFSICQVVKGLMLNDWGDGYEKSILAETAKKRSVNASTDAQGGYLIPEEISAQIVPLFTARQILSSLGVTPVQIGVGTFGIPKQTGGAVAGWLGEEDPLTETAATFGEVQVTPKRAGAFTKVSKRFIKLAIAGAEDMIRMDLFGALGRLVDLSAFLGSGTANQPSGIITLLKAEVDTPQVLKLGPDPNTGLQLTFNEIGLFEGVLEDNDALLDGGRLAFVAHPRVWRKMKRERIPQYSGDTKGAYVMLPMSDVQLRDAIGYPYAKTTQFPLNLDIGTSTGVGTYALFGDFSYLFYALWHSIEIGASDTAGNAGGSAFLQEQVWIKVSTEVDFQIRNNQAFCVAEDVLTPID